MLSLCNRLMTVRRFVPAQDADGGLDPDNCYPDSAVIASGVWCVAQNLGGTREAEVMGRVCTAREWAVGVPAVYPVASWGLKVNDRLDLLAADGVTVTDGLYVTDAVDAGGRGAVYEIPAAQLL